MYGKEAIANRVSIAAVALVILILVSVQLPGRHSFFAAADQVTDIPHLLRQLAAGTGTLELFQSEDQLLLAFVLAFLLLLSLHFRSKRLKYKQESFPYFPVTSVTL